MIDHAVRAILVADGGVAPLIGGADAPRCYPMVLPQPPTWPAITYQRISTLRESTHDGPDGVPRIRMQVDVRARTHAAARDLADAVRVALDDWKGTVGSDVIQRVQVIDERDEYEDAAQVFRVSIDLYVTFEERRAR